MSPPVSSPVSLPAAAREVVDDFRRAWGQDARVWVRAEEGWVLAGQGEEPEECGPGPDAVDAGDGAGVALRVEVPGLPPDEARPAARFLASMVSRSLRHDAEVRSISREIAERYEEITLLYSISEILGSVISLERAAGTILEEVIGILGARRASLWVHDPEADLLHLAAAVGGDGHRDPIPVSDPCSVTAEVFRERRSVLLGPGEEYPRPDCDPAHVQRGSFLSVPVSYTPPEGETRTIGVINLVGRSTSEAFSAGDFKLLSAIASQIGAAVENNRLIAESLRQERMVRELELAHDLQLKLLPPLEQFEGYAEVAARCAPAESVGGDFYHLFRLPGGRLGVMIGDVSSHGFGAALIMALTMSAVAIHASEGDPPAEVLRRVHSTLIDELETTEMYLTLFYGVIDPAEGRIDFANAGHAHAFRVTGEGAAERLAATDPPLGIVDLEAYHETSVPWRSGEDLLFLFTDGLSDSLEAGEVAGERILLDEVARSRRSRASEVVDRLFHLGPAPGEVPPDDRTAVLVRF
ncbi:MAG TPA: GAF domain-containing SpoIIE family protein phosphatase [Longimicrobiaceae bacterium]|nr:GAF domain-containing SpoIIE family protein phosphatase [Longimicrobiaceae bacterium]